MPAYPAAIIRKAADAVERELMSGTEYSEHLDSEEAIARAVLDAVAADLGSAVAEKILAHLDEHTADPATPAMPQTHRHRIMAKRRDFATAARVAAFAFLTEDDKLRLAAEALAAGQFVACPAPEDTDGR